MSSDVVNELTEALIRANRRIETLETANARYVDQLRDRRCPGCASLDEPVAELDPYDIERTCGQCGEPFHVGQMVRLSTQGIIHDRHTSEEV